MVVVFDNWQLNASLTETLPCLTVLTRTLRSPPHFQFWSIFHFISQFLLPVSRLPTCSAVENWLRNVSTFSSQDKAKVQLTCLCVVTGTLFSPFLVAWWLRVVASTSWGMETRNVKVPKLTAVHILRRTWTWSQVDLCFNSRSQSLTSELLWASYLMALKLVP